MSSNLSVLPQTQSAAQAVQQVQSGQHIYLTGNCAVPRLLLQALIDRAVELDQVELIHPLVITQLDYLNPRLAGHLRANTLFISPNVRQAVNEGRADFTPIALSQLPLLFKRGVMRADFAFLHCSMPDSEGFCTLGTEAGITQTIAESARYRFAEINPQMPRTFGDSRIHVNQLDAIIAADYPLAELPVSEDSTSLIAEQIARHIADRIPDGATLQIGFGSIPNALYQFLGGKKDLGIHSELISDGIIDLVESGIITGSQKSLHSGKIVAGFAMGTRRLYHWLDQNPLVELYRTEYINHPFTISQNANMVAVNSALEIDLTGQVCADSIGTRLFSGIGGQFDFIYGASLSEGGMPVIALPSTFIGRDGKMNSRIVPTLKIGAGVTTSRNYVHYVTTEYGMVDLFGKSICQRAALLTAIAHPAFRDDLKAQARSLHYLE